MSFDKYSNIHMNIKAAIYVRVSTLTQVSDGMGIEGQIDACKTMCEIKNYEIYKIYSDAGISGAIEGHERSEFNKLLIDAENKLFNVIVFYKLDRLGRKLHVISNIIEKLVKLNVKPIFVEDNLDTTTDDGMFMFNIMASISIRELTIIKSRLHNGYKTRKSLDGNIGGRLPYGYSRINKKISINENHVVIIKLIFNLIEKNTSMNKIAKILNDENIETSSGKGKWYSETIKRILNNKNKYNGTELINNNDNMIYWPIIQ